MNVQYRVIYLYVLQFLAYDTLCMMIRWNHLYDGYVLQAYPLWFVLCYKTVSFNVCFDKVFFNLVFLLFIIKESEALVKG